MLIALNSAVRRQRRRLVVLAAMLALVGAVAAAHSAMADDHMGDAMVMCVAVVETAVVAVGAAIALVALDRRPPWLIAAPVLPKLPVLTSDAGIRERAGPPVLQVFRL